MPGSAGVAQGCRLQHGALWCAQGNDGTRLEEAGSRRDDPKVRKEHEREGPEFVCIPKKFFKV